MDIRAHGKDFDRFVNRAKNEYGIRYIRSIPSTVKELQQSKNLLVKYVREDGTLVEEEYDMVVLSVGLTPPAEARELATALGIELEEHGFCATDLENPVKSTKGGVFVCGAFGGPKDIPETVMEASGAAACASSIIADRRGTMIVEEELPMEKDLRGLGPRIGVFVCHCGLNIAKTVRVSELAEFARTLPDVVIAEDYKFMCSTPGQELIQNDIKKHRLDRVIIAACSPLMHEKTFRKVVEAAGLNQYLLTIVNVREQTSWVTDDEDAATEKAKALINGAVYRARLLNPLTSRYIDVNPDVMVIGGGLPVFRQP